MGVMAMRAGGAVALALLNPAAALIPLIKTGPGENSEMRHAACKCACIDTGIGAAKALPHAVDEITALAVDFTLHQTMHVGFEAGEFFIEIAREFQVVDDGLVEAFAWNQ